MTARVRARELGLPLGRFKPGKHNAITDVAGVLVGHSTIIRGEPGPPVNEQSLAKCRTMRGWTTAGALYFPSMTLPDFNINPALDAQCRPSGASA